jgi:hypothetical protein
MSILNQLLDLLKSLTDRVLALNKVSRETQKALLYILVIVSAMLIIMIVQTILIKWAQT